MKIQTATPKLKNIYFIITRRCNLACSHCIRTSGPNIHDALTLQEFKLALHNLEPYLQKNTRLLLSGGEPTLHPDFLPMLEHAKAIFTKITINTNGLRKKQLINAIEILPSLTIQVSLDGDESSRDKIRGAGSFKRALSNISTLSKLNANVIVATTASKKNITALDSLDSELSPIPFVQWNIKREIIYGRSQHKTALSTGEWNDFVFSFNEKSLNKHRLELQSHFAFNKNSLENIDKNTYARENQNCGTGTSKLYINPNLTTYPCGCMEEINLGNLIKEPIESFEANFRKIKPILSENSPCHFCPFVKACNGGCPGYSLRTYGQIGVGDPRCPSINDLLSAG